MRFCDDLIFILIHMIRVNPKTVTFKIPSNHATIFLNANIIFVSTGQKIIAWIRDVTINKELKLNAFCSFKNGDCFVYVR